MDQNVADRPKLLGDKNAIQERLAQIHEPHVAPLTDFVLELRQETKAEAFVPYFDPWDGGIHTEILFLLETPGRKAVQSGFVSRNNPDETAKNMFELAQESEIHRKRTILWNVVPWYIGGDGRKRSPSDDDIKRSRGPLKQLLRLIPKLKAIVLMGKKAQKSRRFISELQPKMAIFECFHPSPSFVNRDPDNRAKILDVLKDLQSFSNT